jgi:hypothetical protein
MHYLDNPIIRALALSYFEHFLAGAIYKITPTFVNQLTSTTCGKTN